MHDALLHLPGDWGQVKARMLIKESGRKHGFSHASCYKWQVWRSRFGGMDVSDAASRPRAVSRPRRIKCANVTDDSSLERTGVAADNGVSGDYIADCWTGWLPLGSLD